MRRYSKYNNGYEYILTCIDYFSRKCWMRGLKNKTSNDVRQALQSITEEAGVRPYLIMKDNGGEFQGLVNDWMREHGIKFVNTLSHSPQSNGLIERFNGTIRRMIREYFIRTNGFRWISILPQLEENFNTMRNGTTKYSPNQLWIPESYPPDDADENNVPRSANEEQRQLVKQRIEEHAEKTKGKDILYNVGT